MSHPNTHRKHRAFSNLGSILICGFGACFEIPAILTGIRFSYLGRQFFKQRSCTSLAAHGPFSKFRKGAESLELYGVPGQVRTASLPLRRGMLYPIELLGQNASALIGTNGTACILTASHCFVMSSLAFELVVRRTKWRDCRGIVHFATPHNDIIAKCNIDCLVFNDILLIFNEFLLK